MSSWIVIPATSYASHYEMGDGVTTDGASIEAPTEPAEVSILPDYVNMNISFGAYRNLIIILFIILFIVMVIFIAYYYNYTKQAIFTKFDPSKIKPIYKQNILPNIHSNSGDAPPGSDGEQPHVLNASKSGDKLTCLAAPQQRWSGMSCICAPPFWGSYCDRESYSTDFKAIGSYDPAEMNVIETLKVNRKAFPYDPELQPIQTTCEQACRDNADCVGYYYVNDGDNMGIGSLEPTNTCKLLGSPPIYRGETYDPSVDANTYLLKSKTKGRPLLPNSVIIYNGNLPNRFWLEKRIETAKLKMVNIMVNTLNSINFYPGGVIDDDEHIIVYSSTHFTRSQAEEFVREYVKTGQMPGGVHIYIYGKTSLYPPFEWSARGNPYWVMALDVEGVNPKPPKPKTCKVNVIESVISDRTPTPEPSSRGAYSGRDRWQQIPIKSIGSSQFINPVSSSRSFGLYRSPSMENFSVSPLLSGLDETPPRHPYTPNIPTISHISHTPDIFTISGESHSR